MSFLDSLKKIAGVEQTTEPQAPQKEVPQPQSSNTLYEATQGRGAGGPMELRMVYPTTFSEVVPIAKDLMNHRTVVINMEQTPPDVMRRLLDFLAGVAFCINGQLQQIGSRTYIITPPTIDLTGEQFATTPQPQQAAYQEPEANPAQFYAAQPQPQPQVQQPMYGTPVPQPQQNVPQDQGAYPGFDPFRMQ